VFGQKRRTKDHFFRCATRSVSFTTSGAPAEGSSQRRRNGNGEATGCTHCGLRGKTGPRGAGFGCRSSQRSYGREWASPEGPSRRSRRGEYCLVDLARQTATQPSTNGTTEPSFSRVPSCLLLRTHFRHAVKALWLAGDSRSTSVPKIQESSHREA